MAVHSLGRGVGRLLGRLRGRLGHPCGVGAPRRAASGPPGSAPAAAAAAAAQPGSYQALSVLAAQEPAAFWGPLARDTLVWDTPYHTVWDCDFSSGKIGWFLGGQLNVSGEWASGDPGRPQLLRPEGLGASRQPQPSPGGGDRSPSGPPLRYSARSKPWLHVTPSLIPSGPDPRAQLRPAPAGTRCPHGLPGCRPRPGGSSLVSRVALLGAQRGLLSSAPSPDFPVPAPGGGKISRGGCHCGCGVRALSGDKPCPRKQTELRPGGRKPGVAAGTSYVLAAGLGPVGREEVTAASRFQFLASENRTPATQGLLWTRGACGPGKPAPASAGGRLSGTC
ncbi:hypothetical protein P7K49_009170 [Saguinus oedipus]|uniref:Acetyl-coenzyme A synthetase N-terminal domain-containing protein n=1 Tax=Saguinus oedipus TaxID=9490 RepID=A0ABQ9VJ72_SAGOE|nr:hypothetical protein P7K49_009170 [Saguinus oedipus]